MNPSPPRCARWSSGTLEPGADARIVSPHMSARTSEGPSSDPAAVLAAARRRLSRLPETLAALVSDLDATMARTRPDPDEWAPVEILCHLRDEETEDFGARLRAVLAGQDQFPPIDPVGWVEARRYRDEDIHQILAVVCTRRGASLAFLEGVVAERLTASLPHRALGRLSALDIVAAWAAHDQLHLSQLAATLARLWANRWPDLSIEYAGPIPYPPRSVRSEGAQVPTS